MPTELTGEWHELSFASWEVLEESLDERLSSVISAINRGQSTNEVVGRKTQVDTLCKVLEEVFALQHKKHI